MKAFYTGGQSVGQSDSVGRSETLGRGKNWQFVSVFQLTVDTPYVRELLVRFRAGLPLGERVSTRFGQLPSAPDKLIPVTDSLFCGVST